MRKSINRTTVLIVLAVFLTLSVGYALFSDTITIEGTATAQGNFDIEASCIKDVSTDMLYEYGFIDDQKDHITVAEQFKQHGYKDVSCVVNDDTVTYSVGLEYPTAKKYSFVKMKNNGSIPAYYKFDLENFRHANIVKKYDEQNNLLETINTDGTGLYNFIELDLLLMVAQDVDGNYYNLHENYDEFVDKFGFEDEETYELTFILKPGESLYIPLIAEWFDGKDGYNENNVKYEAIGTFEFDWQQYTE